MLEFNELINSKEFHEVDSNLGVVLGKTACGEVITCDIAKMPHILIAGTMGSGRATCVHSIIMSILSCTTPDEVRFVIIDPKMVELFSTYDGIPHLLTPIVTDPTKAAGALGWAVTEMKNRLKRFSEYNVQDLFEYNLLRVDAPELEKIPQVVIFIEELADLMMYAPDGVEQNVCKLAQMGHTAGIHLVIATTRPSCDVITDTIKNSIPGRIAFKVASQTDSRTIINMIGAEELLGKGDMLFLPTGAPKAVRAQQCWVSKKVVDKMVALIKDKFKLDYDENIIEEIERQVELSYKNNGNNVSINVGDEHDDRLDEAIDAVIEAGQASTSYLQRKLGLGYRRAVRLTNLMEQMGVIGKFEGSKPRQVIMTRQEWNIKKSKL